MPPSPRLALTPSALGLAAEHRLNLVKLELLRARTITREFSEENKNAPS